MQIENGSETERVRFGHFVAEGVPDHWGRPGLYEVYVRGFLPALVEEHDAADNVVRGVLEAIEAVGGNGLSERATARIRRAVPTPEQAERKYVDAIAGYQLAAARSAAAAPDEKIEMLRRRLAAERRKDMWGHAAAEPEAVARTLTNRRDQREKQAVWGLRLGPGANAKARFVAARVFAGEVRRPRTYRELRDAFRDAEDALPRRFHSTVLTGKALLEANRIAELCFEILLGDRIVGGFLSPGRRDGKRRLIEQVLAKATEPWAPPRRRAYAACFVASILWIVTMDPLPEASDRDFIESSIRALREAKVRNGVVVEVRRVVSGTLNPSQAAIAINRLERAAATEKTGLPKLSAGGPVPEVQAPRSRNMLYLGRDGRSIELGETPLRCPPYGRVGDRPVTVRNAMGRLLLWLARGAQGSPADVPRSARTGLQRALTAAKSESNLVGTGGGLRLAPMLRVDPALQRAARPSR